MKKSYMKVWIIVALILATFTLLAILNNNRKGSVKSNNIKICTTFNPVYILTAKLVEGIDNIEVINITRNITGCIHDYTLTTEDMKNIESSNLLLINGANMEEFLSNYLSSNKNIQLVDLGYNTKMLEGEHHDEFNSHIYLDIENYMLQIENAYKAIVKVVDEKSKEILLSNKTKYIEELEALKEYENILEQIKDKKIVLSHNSFEYIFNNYDVDIVSILEEEHESEISIEKLSNIIESNKVKKIDAIFVTKDFDVSRITNLVSETGIKVYTLDAITSSDSADYIKVMKLNIDAIFEALVK